MPALEHGSGGSTEEQEVPTPGRRPHTRSTIGSVHAPTHFWLAQLSHDLTPRHADKGLHLRLRGNQFESFPLITSSSRSCDIIYH